MRDKRYDMTSVAMDAHGLCVWALEPSWTPAGTVLEQGAKISRPLYGRRLDRDLPLR